MCCRCGCCHLSCYVCGFRRQSSLRLGSGRGLDYGLVIRRRYGLNLNIRPVNCGCDRLSKQDQDEVRVPVCKDSMDGMDSKVPVCASMGHTMDHTKGHTTMFCTKVCTIHPSPS